MSVDFSVAREEVRFVYVPCLGGEYAFATGEPIHCLALVSVAVCEGNVCFFDLDSDYLGFRSAGAHFNC